MNHIALDIWYFYKLIKTRDDKFILRIDGEDIRQNRALDYYMLDFETFDGNNADDKKTFLFQTFTCSQDQKFSPVKVITRNGVCLFIYFFPNLFKIFTSYYQE